MAQFYASQLLLKPRATKAEASCRATASQPGIGGPAAVGCQRPRAGELDMASWLTSSPPRGGMTFEQVASTPPVPDPRTDLVGRIPIKFG